MSFSFQFKVGDKVKVLTAGDKHFGRIFTIKSVHGTLVTPHYFVNEWKNRTFGGWELEKVDE